MPNGKPGDHPFTDIVVHGQDLFSPRIAQLVREIAGLCDDKTRRTLADRLPGGWTPLPEAELEQLERDLIELRERLLREAQQR